MIAVLAYWVLLFAMFLPAGILVQRVFNITTSNTVIILLLGMFLQTTGFTIAAFFIRLSWEVFSVTLIFSAVLLFIYHRECKLQLITIKNQYKQFPLYIKAAIVFVFLAVLFQSAQQPQWVDNESYYVQTIKWLNEYGFVKGLGNLHLFFAQSSGWHVLQAGLNLNFFTCRINDLNGFLFVICTWYYFCESYTYFAKYNKLHWLGLLPLFLVLFLLFVPVPSPDLVLLTVTPILLNLFVKENTLDNNRISALLFSWLVFIKITIAPLALLLLFRYRPARNKAVTLAILFTGLLWISKNIIISGHPLYPFTFVDIGCPWAIPELLTKGVHETSNKYIYGTNINAALVNKLISWFMIGGIDGLFNKLIVVLFAVMSFLRRVRKNRNYLIIYLVMLLHFIILLCTSPQVRFFLPELIFFTAVICGEFINFIKPKLVLYKIALCIAFLLAIIFISIISVNNTTLSTVNTLYEPELNSAANTAYKKVTIGNMQYFAPLKPSTFYFTGDGLLPCVNEVQIKRFEEKYHVIPQLRGSSLADGFYSATLQTGYEP